jgi:hypothetical protein
MTARMGRLYPLKAFTKAEAVKVIAFELHKPEPDSEGMRSGVVAMAWVVGFFIVVALVVAGLLAYGVTHL